MEDYPRSHRRALALKAEKLKPQPDGMDDLYLRWTNKTLDEHMGASANLPQFCIDAESRLIQAGIDDG
jgi:hypothetical protein